MFYGGVMLLTEVAFRLSNDVDCYEERDDMKLKAVIKKRLFFCLLFVLSSSPASRKGCPDGLSQGKGLEVAQLTHTSIKNIVGLCERFT